MVRKPLKSRGSVVGVGEVDLSHLSETELEAYLTDQLEPLQQGEMPSEDWLRQHFKTKSARIRFLFSKGHKVKEISQYLGLRYQHVRNVVTTELKRGPNESWHPDNYRSPTLGPESDD